jgi:hypothetical protein
VKQNEIETWRETGKEGAASHENDQQVHFLIGLGTICFSVFLFQGKGRV